MVTINSYQRIRASWQVEPTCDPCSLPNAFLHIVGAAGYRGDSWAGVRCYEIMYGGAGGGRDPPDVGSANRPRRAFANRVGRGTGGGATDGGHGCPFGAVTGQAPSNALQCYTVLPAERSQIHSPGDWATPNAEALLQQVPLPLGWVARDQMALPGRRHLAPGNTSRWSGLTTACHKTGRWVQNGWLATGFDVQAFERVATPSPCVR
jgi:hypothetical protein